MLKPISSFLVNEQGVVGKIKTRDKNIVNSLKQFNIRIGSKVKVISKEKGQPILIGISDGRVGLNATVAASIYVLNN